MDRVGDEVDTAVNKSPIGVGNKMVEGFGFRLVRFEWLESLFRNTSVDVASSIN
jgi:hypothetical protein